MNEIERLMGVATGLPWVADECPEDYDDEERANMDLSVAAVNALPFFLAAAKEAGRLRRELEYASDDLAFLDALRARLEKLEAFVYAFLGWVRPEESICRICSADVGTPHESLCLGAWARAALFDDAPPA